MAWIDYKNKCIRSSVSDLIVASFVDFGDPRTFWYLARPRKNKKFKYPLNLKY